MDVAVVEEVDPGVFEVADREVVVVDPVGVVEGVVDHEVVDAGVVVNLLVLLYVQIH